MKRIFLSLVATLSLVSGVSAQLVVLEDGRTVIGNMPINKISNTGASLNLWDLSKDKGGSIAFGENDGAIIAGDGESGELILKVQENFGIAASDKLIMLYLNGSKCIRFGWPVQSSSFLTQSDSRLKTNVSSIDNIHLQLANVNPVSYNLCYPVENDTIVLGAVPKTTEFITEDRTRYGFIAQEVQEIFPNLVVEGEDGYLSIDYIGFIPVLVDAYKELTVKLAEQEELITELLGHISPNYKPASVSSFYDGQIVLKQNKPNPFNTITTIDCEIPESVGNAFICIYDIQGHQLSRLNLHDRGNVSVSIEASTLNPGIYIYSLIADGTEIDSKRMIITD